MPFKSQAQRRKFYAMSNRGEISKATVKHWEDVTPKDRKLSERVKHAAFLDELGEIMKAAALEESLLSLFAHSQVKPRLQAKMEAARHAAQNIGQPERQWSQGPREVFLA